jgi:hypothetical protein
LYNSIIDELMNILHLRILNKNIFTIAGALNAWVEVGGGGNKKFTLISATNEQAQRNRVCNVLKSLVLGVVPWFIPMNKILFFSRIFINY